MSTARYTGTKPTSKRDVAAAVEYLATAELAPGIHAVVNDEGDTYMVDAVDGACSCPDFRFRSEVLGDDGCKHRRRVAMERGDRPLPPIPRSRIDPLLLRVREGNR